MTNDEIINQLERGDIYESFEAGERYRKVHRDEDLARLIAAFETRSTNPKFKDEIARWDIVTLIGLLKTPAASEFLRKVARSRINPQIRYDAMRSLIELGRADWRPIPETRKKLGSDFYLSLLAYEKYWRGGMELDTLRSLAVERTKAPGDWWFWLTRLNPRNAKADRPTEVGKTIDEE